MQVARTVEEAKKLVNGKELYLEDTTFFWILTQEDKLERVLKPRTKEKIISILKDGDFPEKYIKEIFSDRKKTEALEAAKKAEQGLILSGKAGTGKTFATIFRIAQLLHLYKINNPLYITFQNFDIKKEQDNKRIMNYDCFLLDDLNTNINSWEKKFATEVIYHAYNNQKPLFITTNATLKDFFKFIEEEPVISRLLEICKTFELKEKTDLRLKKI